jgi:predicted hotdog family 3-hydroxylacyl-ACP dehydratase
MRFVDRLVHFEGGFAKLESGPWQTHLLADADGALDPLALLEMMAQSYAAARGYESLLNDEAEGEGFLVGVRGFKVHGEAQLGDVLRTEVRETDTLDSFHLADAAVYRRDELLAEGSIRVWASPAKTSERGK